MRKLVLKDEYGNECSTPLTTSFSWQKMAAYIHKIRFCAENPMPLAGEKLNILVYYPVCCWEGERFASIFGEEGDFIVMRLLNIKKYMTYYAKLHVEILSVGNRLSYVKPVSEDEKQCLFESQTYDYHAPFGDGLPEYGYIDTNISFFQNNQGGGDIVYEDYIYTDEDGIDHLVQRNFYCFERNEAYFGDRVLGYHKFSPYFPPRPKLPDGTLAPEIPYGFMGAFERMINRKGGVASYLQIAIKAAKEHKGDGLSFGESNGLYTKVYVDWIGKISVDGFIYAMKKVIEEQTDPSESFANKQIVDSYNELIKELESRSYGTNSFEKYKVSV